MLPQIPNHNHDGLTSSQIEIQNILGFTIGAGAPTNTPPDKSLYLDTTNNRLYVRIGNAWKYVALT